MQKRWIVLCLILLLSTACNTPVVEKPKQTIGPMIKVFSKATGIASFGTGFFVNYKEKVYLITAYHVTEGRHKLVFKDKSVDILDIEIIKVHTFLEEDVVVIELQESSIYQIESYDLYESSISKKRCEALGFDFDENSVISRNGGSLSNMFTLSDCKLICGMSGGPLLVDGKVYAVNVSVCEKDKIESKHAVLSTILNKLP